MREELFYLKNKANDKAGKKKKKKGKNASLAL